MYKISVFSEGYQQNSFFSTFLTLPHIPGSLGIKIRNCLFFKHNFQRIAIVSGPGWSGRFFSTSNFDLWYFCSLLTYKDVQYLVWKIWFISVWRMKAKVLLWLLTWFIFARSTLISYHTEAFVKTEVGCTVSNKYLRVDFGLFVNP